MIIDYLQKMEDFIWNEFSVRINIIEKIIRDYWILIDDYNINEDGSLDVNGSVKFTNTIRCLKELPLKFNKVSKDFDCSGLNLKTLKGSPAEVGGTFNCSYNKLITLEYLPKKAGCLVFDNTVKSLYTGGLNCDFEKVILIYLTDVKENILPEKVIQNSENLYILFKYQRYIWNNDTSLNEEFFDDLIIEINEGLR